MPFQSEAQRRYLWANHPDIAEAWAHGKHSTTGKTDHKMPRKGRKSRRGRRGTRKGGR